MAFRTNRFIVLAAVVALTACAAIRDSDAPAKTAEAGPPLPAQLGPADIQKLYELAHREDGVVASGRPHAGAHWIRWVKPDGDMKLVAGAGAFTDTGTFAIRGNSFCIAWKTIDHGKETCFHYARIGDNTYASYLVDGTESATFKVSMQ
jgi:hypothetical protein